MCGIAGLLSIDSSPVDKRLVKQMTDVIAHRGPDGEGQDGFFNDSLWIGHRRLSIIDLSEAGSQPMKYANGRYWLIFNGEIYNYIELREELKALGYTFASHSDSEVLIAAYAAWGGRKCLEKLNGMFAFLLVDTQEQKLFAARDRFGIKPLYYWYSPKGLLAFGSEIKEFTVLPGWQASMNHQRVYDFLVWSVSDHTSETMFRDVFQLRGGEAVELDLRDRASFAGRLPVFRWYHLHGNDFRGSFQDAAAAFHDLFKDAVRIHLRSDVPVGSCLSGGLDSSSIVCVVNNLLKEEGAEDLQNTFSATSDEAAFDETEFMHQVVKSRQISDHYILPKPGDVFGTYRDIVWHQDEPFNSTSIYAQWNVFSLAKQHKVKVMLDGQGADEQLGGYHRFFPLRLKGLALRLRLLQLLKESRDINRLHNYSYEYLAKHFIEHMLPNSVALALRKALNVNPAMPQWLNASVLRAEPKNPFAHEIRQHGTPIFNRCYSELTTTNLPMLLHWEDRDAMAHSVEARVPFLDYRLVEFVLGLPDAYKIKDGVTKRVLREGLRDVLPDSIRTRMSKLGFATAEEIWIKKTLTPEFRSHMKDAVEASRGLVNDVSLQRLERIIAGTEQYSFIPWQVICLGEWLQRFNVNVS